MSSKKVFFVFCVLIVFVNKYAETVKETHRIIYPKFNQPDKRKLRIITTNFAVDWFFSKVVIFI